MGTVDGQGHRFPRDLPRLVGEGREVRQAGQPSVHQVGVDGLLGDLGDEHAAQLVDDLGVPFLLGIILNTEHDSQLPAGGLLLRRRVG